LPGWHSGLTFPAVRRQSSNVSSRAHERNSTDGRLREPQPTSLFVLSHPAGGRTQRRRQRSVDRARPIASERRRRERSSVSSSLLRPVRLSGRSETARAFSLPCGVTIPRSSRMARNNYLRLRACLTRSLPNSTTRGMFLCIRCRSWIASFRSSSVKSASKTSSRASAVDTILL
jgi:hypothetical protein